MGVLMFSREAWRHKERETVRPVQGDEILLQRPSLATAPQTNMYFD